MPAGLTAIVVVLLLQGSSMAYQAAPSPDAATPVAEVASAQQADQGQELMQGWHEEQLRQRAWVQWVIMAVTVLFAAAAAIFIKHKLARVIVPILVLLAGAGVLFMELSKVY